MALNHYTLADGSESLAGTISTLEELEVVARAMGKTVHRTAERPFFLTPTNPGDPIQLNADIRIGSYVFLFVSADAEDRPDLRVRS